MTDAPDRKVPDEAEKVLRLPNAELDLLRY
jgi:hypothetical protein